MGRLLKYSRPLRFLFDTSKGPFLSRCHSSLSSPGGWKEPVTSAPRSWQSALSRAEGPSQIHGYMSIRCSRKGQFGWVFSTVLLSSQKLGSVFGRQKVKPLFNPPFSHPPRVYIYGLLLSRVRSSSRGGPSHLVPSVGAAGIQLSRRDALLLLSSFASTNYIHFVHDAPLKHKHPTKMLLKILIDLCKRELLSFYLRIPGCFV